MLKLRSSVAAAIIALLFLVCTSAPSQADVPAGFIVPPLCGDANGNGGISADDALVALRASVGIGRCDGCLCDVNGNAGVTAIDALIVLRVSVGLSATMACPACSGARFRISTESICQATHLTIPSSALPEGLSTEDCALSPGAAGRPCAGSLKIGGTGLVVDVRRSDDALYDYCLLTGPLFSCDVTEEEAAAMIAAAKVACPCNCLPVCPSFGLCNETSGGCTVATQQAATAARASDDGPAAEIEPVASTTTLPIASSSTTTAPPQPTSTSTTFCGTCCNMEELGQIELVESPQVFTELLVRVPGETTEHGCLFCDSGDGYPSGRFVSLGHEDGDSSLLCIIDDHGITQPGVVGACEGYGVIVPGPGEVLRGSGINFEPLSALPAVKVNAP